MQNNIEKIETICEKLQEKGVSANDVEISYNMNSGYQFSFKQAGQSEKLNEIFKEIEKE